MLAGFRPRLTYANVMATAAMFVALGGGAYALTGIPDRGGVFHGCVSNKTALLRVVRHASSCRKPKGHGKLRDRGEFAVSWNQRGRPGPFLSTVPSGSTLKGAFNLDDVAGAASQFSHQGISFGFSLRSRPSVQIVPVGGPATSQCPGSAPAPAATPGVMCVYEQTTSNLAAVNGLGAEDPASGDSNVAGTTGADLYIQSAASGRFYAGGTWAVTAP